jgi:hypothetical protein
MKESNPPADFPKPPPPPPPPEPKSGTLRGALSRLAERAGYRSLADVLAKTARKKIKVVK